VTIRRMCTVISIYETTHLKNRIYDNLLSYVRKYIYIEYSNLIFDAADQKVRIRSTLIMNIKRFF